jgi:DNA-binding MarR family transcriptional regulator
MKKRSFTLGHADGSRPDEFALGLNDIVGYNLRRAHGIQRQRFTHVFAPLGIRPVLLAILGLVYEQKAILQSELGRRLAIKRANIVPLLDELEQRGLLKRRPDSADRRAHMVELTPAGRKLTNKLVELHTKLEHDMIEHLGARERDQLLVLLRKFLRLDPEPELDPD